MRIGIDIDNTITNTLETLYPYFEKYKKENNIDSKTIFNGICYREVLGLTEEQYSDFATKYFEKISYELKPKDFVVEILKKISKNNEIIFVTARSENYYHEPYNITYNWLTYNNIPFKKLIVGALEKGEIALEENINIFIDDNIENCKAVSEQGIDVLLFETKFNRNCKKFRRVKNWNQIYKIIEKREKEWMIEL
ncbi:MAG: hypothetical protein RR404_03955 [Bacilli bacterium]